LVDEGGRGHEELGDEAVRVGRHAVEAFAEDEVAHDIVGKVRAVVGHVAWLGPLSRGGVFGENIAQRLRVLDDERLS